MVSTMTTDAKTPPQTTSYLTRPEGRIGYDVEGTGPLVVLVPGMGDLRSTYRFLAPAIRDSGFRVACTDLRGHGDSDATFSSYGDTETAGDVTALIEELGGTAVVVGNAMGAAVGALIAAERPDLVAGLVLVGPFVRNGKTNAAERAILRVLMAPMWVAAAGVWPRSPRAAETTGLFRLRRGGAMTPQKHGCQTCPRRQW